MLVRRLAAGLRRAGGITVLFAALGVTVPAPPPLIQGYCRTDPIVILTDGTVIHLFADLATAPRNVQVVAYTLHAPVGSQVAQVVYTPGLRETFQFYADDAAHQFDSDTIVYTGNTGVAVTTTTRLFGQSRSASGYERQHLQVRVIQ